MNRLVTCLVAFAAVSGCGKAPSPQAPTATTPSPSAADAQPTAPSPTAASDDASAAPAATAASDDASASPTPPTSTAPASAADATAAPDPATTADATAGQPTTAADATTAAPDAKVVLAIDAGPEAKDPDLVAGTGWVDLGKAAVCDQAGKDASMSCGADGTACGCHVLELGRAGNDQLAILQVKGDGPGVVGHYAIVRKGDKAWEPIFDLGDENVSNMAPRSETIRIHHVGSADFGAVGRWVWVDRMDDDASEDAGRTWTRDLVMCGGSDKVDCFAVPLKLWWTAQMEPGHEPPDGLPEQPRDLRTFALAVSLDDAGNLTADAKTPKPPDSVMRFLGTHSLAELARSHKPESVPEPSAPASAETPSPVTPAAPASGVVFTIDAGPKATTGPELAGGRAWHDLKDAAVCSDTREVVGMDCYGGPSEAGPCDCRVLELGAAGPDQLGLLWVTANVYPGTVGSMWIARKAGKTWKRVRDLGIEDSGNRGDWYNDFSVHHFGAVDAGAALGKWTWVDVMNDDMALGRGRVWTRTLWLCGGTTKAACHAVPLKMWFDGTVPDGLGAPAGAKWAKPDDVDLYALAITLDDKGMLTVVAKTPDAPARVQPLLGTYALSELARLVPGE